MCFVSLRGGGQGQSRRRGVCLVKTLELGLGTNENTASQRATTTRMYGLVLSTRSSEDRDAEEPFVLTRGWIVCIVTRLNDYTIQRMGCSVGGGLRFVLPHEFFIYLSFGNKG